MKQYNHKLAVLVAATLFLAHWANAAVSYQDIWFPDGQVSFFIEPDAEDLSDQIVETMTYMSEHTPLVITEAGGPLAANLHFAGTWVAPNGGGYTNNYWDENHNDANQKIRFDPNHPPSRGTVAHEFGHALGWPHEFQRDSRDEHVDVCFNIDPFNYSPVGSVYWPDPYFNLSPYDFASVMNDGYSSCVTPLAGQNQQSRHYDTVHNLISVHDINAIYRMHGKGLGTNDPGDRFGVAVSSGDYDDDGFKDVVVANVQNHQLWLSFFRGVATDTSENVAGLKWMPWFKALHDGDVSNKNVNIATGDFNGDGIDDIAVGQPGYDGNRGRVSILFVNSLPSDPEKNGTIDEEFAPWGRKGVQYRIDLLPGDFGITSGSRSASRATNPTWQFTGTDPIGVTQPGYRPQFGAGLAAVRATNFRDSDSDAIYHDLIIGAPKAGNALAFDDTAKGAVIIIIGRVNTSPANYSTSDFEVLWSPDPVAGFGDAVAAVPGRCVLPDQTATFNVDFLAVGAPNYNNERGSIHIYGCATSGGTSVLNKPELLNSLYGVDEGSRFGHSLVGFRINTGHGRDCFLAVGQPDYTATSGLKSGRVAIYEITRLGVPQFETSRVPSVHSGNDDFGFSLAVHQRKLSNDQPIEGGYQTWLGIGMPGTEVDGHKAGKVVIWRPFNDDGSHNGIANIVEAANPDARSTTRFGKSIAVLRPFAKKGGFVAGAPRAITISDDVEAGQVSTLQNNGGNFTWSTIRRNLNQETDGDKRANNL